MSDDLSSASSQNQSSKKRPPKKGGKPDGLTTGAGESGIVSDDVPIERAEAPANVIDIRTLPQRPLEEELEGFRTIFNKLKTEIQKAIVAMTIC
ncbi:hypothetical protein [Verrucomicrobium spinosum]|uniref:hypothetical protein n=1 Tax=Verrucomicrobium spinosum TaxID=2736 RepID=UPI000B17AA86|nr:hypothetical protein [Verrucomicrobium spinosum]